MGHEGNTVGLLNLVDDLVPIADAFQGYLGPGRELGEEVADGTPRVVHAVVPDGLTLRIEDGEEREMLVGVAADLIM